MGKQINVGSVVTVRSIATGETIVIAPKRITAAVKAAAAAQMPAWLETTVDHTSEAGAVLSFRSIL
jgi:hypothetical protein